MSNKSLIQLYAEHTGKVSDKWSLYLREYDRLFSRYRDKPVNLLEIGVQNGGSLDVWIKYFNAPNCLVGCDINPDCAVLSYEDPRIHIVVGDANSLDTSKQIFSHSAQFDIVIDDGSHFSSDIIKSFAIYFPRLVNDGLFIAEDLHCSYWHQFEGGLFDPHSSISFFKRLADIINHEHWGISSERSNILRGIFTKYHFEIDENVLSQVHSVEFVNSMCVVRKTSAVDNYLGIRVLAGTFEAVVPGLSELSNQLSSPFDQTVNPWSNRKIPPDEVVTELEQKIIEATEHRFEIESQNKDINQELMKCSVQIATLTKTASLSDVHIGNLTQILANRDFQINAIYNSISWRLTRPLRFVNLQQTRVRRALKLVPVVLERAGGLRSALKKAGKLYKREGFEGVKRTFRQAAHPLKTPAEFGSNKYDRNDYDEWVSRYDALSSAQRATMIARVDDFTDKPLISVVMPTYNPKSAWLIEAIESVIAQIYPNWELCIADDASTDKNIRTILTRYAEQDKRIKVVYRSKNEHISAASNSALDLAKGRWVALLDHDDMLGASALFLVVEAINKNSNLALIYSDEDKIDELGNRKDPYFKCDWNLDLFYSHNIFCHLGVYRLDLIKQIGGFRVGFEGAQDYDLTLRCIERVRDEQIHHIPKVLYHWRIHPASTAQSIDAKPYAVLAGERALNEHFQRIKINGRVESTTFGFRVRYELPSNLPLVSLIIPTRNGVKLIRQCITSILEKTTYENYEILIVDNGSDDLDTLQYFESLKANSKIRILRDDRPFNYSSLNNSAVEQAGGEIIGLLNNDVEVISPDWLSEMVSLALQPEVGAVGAKLWYPGDTVQHAGVVLGIGGVAGHVHKHLAKKQSGYMCRAQLIQGFSALTAACIVIRKTTYQEVNGLNEKNLQVAFNDVDFCLRLREAGYRNVWTPYAELYHHESATRGLEDTPKKQLRFQNEVHYMTERWGNLLLNDPAYSPNLTLEHEDLSLAWPPRV